MVYDFKLPIQYVKHNTLNDIIISDLEMNKSYNNIFKDSELNKEWCKYYSTDKAFLKQTQTIIKSYKSNIYNFNDFLKEYNEFKKETNFIDKYQYINIKSLQNLNHSPLFMQTLSMYNLSAPIISLCTPIFIFIVPYFILKIKKVPIEINHYITLIEEIIKKSNMFKLFDPNVSHNQRVSGLLSIIFYIFQIYQNTISCISFYKNIHYIGNFINKYKLFCQSSIQLIEDINKNIQGYDKYKDFNYEMIQNKHILNTILTKINIILPYNNSISRLAHVGVMMSLFYNLFYNIEYDDTIQFIQKLNCYNIDLHHLKNLVSQKKINICKYTNHNSSFKKMYYLPHILIKHVKNNISIDKNIIITGPNASGKTTLLKSVLMNIIMSQQFGYGCYKKANIKVYDYFHSYLNIPDTSERDSLFQAEARRCKDILEFITEKNDKKHFCIFDEIYSGTNPNDATICAKIYLKGLNNFNHLDFILTTHYIELCEYFNHNKKYENIINLKMNVEEDKDKNKLKYNYTIENGISYIHGGKQILKDLNYPEYLFEL